MSVVQIAAIAIAVSGAVVVARTREARPVAVPLTIYIPVRPSSRIMSCLTCGREHTGYAPVMEIHTLGVACESACCTGRPHCWKCPQRCYCAEH